MATNDPKAFSDRLVGILNSGALNLALAIGYRAGIFDYMDAQQTPCTLAQMAAGCDINARYLKEWLGIMVCGEIVELHADGEAEDRFYLPQTHGDLLCRRAGSKNLGVYTQETPLLTTCALEALMADLQQGEGLAYGHYPRFQRFMAQLADAKHRAVLVDSFLPSVAQGAMVTAMQRGIQVCDLGCGTGLALCLMAAAFPASQFVGLDLDGEALAVGREESAAKGLSNVRFDRVDAASTACGATYRNSFDYITAFDAIHDQRRPLAALRNVVAMLRPGGAFSMIDIAADSSLAANRGHPMGSFLYTVSLMHCLPVGLADGGAGLGMMWGRQKAVELLTEAGFGEVSVEEIPDDPFNDHFFCRL